MTLLETFTLKNILENDSAQFLEDEINLRKEKNLPPFTRLIALIISSKNEKDGILEAKKIKKKFIYSKICRSNGTSKFPNI